MITPKQVSRFTFHAAHKSAPGITRERLSTDIMVARRSVLSNIQDRTSAVQKSPALHAGEGLKSASVVHVAVSAGGLGYISAQGLIQDANMPDDLHSD